jgi:biotin transport system substrate-specific component
MTLGSIVLCTCGVAQLSRFMGGERALQLGLYPFILGDALKMAIAAGILPGAWWLLDRIGLRPR